MLAELLEEQHGEERRAEQPARRHVEGRRWLRDGFAIPAGDLLPQGLDHLPLARDHLERLGDVLAELREPCSATGRAGTRGRDDHPLARQVLGQRLAGRAAALERRNPGSCRGHEAKRFFLAGGGLQFLEAEFHLVNELSAALRPRPVERPAHLLVLQLEECVARFEIGVDRPHPGGIGGRGIERCHQGSDVDLGPGAGGFHERHGITDRRAGEAKSAGKPSLPAYPAAVGRQLCCGLRQSMPSSRHASCAAVSETMPSVAEGQMKRPFSRRLA